MTSSPRFTRYSKWNPDGAGPPQDEDLQREPPRPTRTQSALEYVLFGAFAFLLAVAAIALYTSYSPSHRKVPNRIAEGLARDRVNIVVIGVGGSSHPGGGKDLADAILLLSLQPSTRKAAVISIPRDLWVRIGRYGTHRLNRAHEIGNDTGYPGAGPGLLCDTISQIFGQPVHGFVRVDFKAFESIIDRLGGVDVYVGEGFYDYLFRDGFPKGWQHLDGRRALAYTRYRYIIGPEGDNFAREMRQQQVIDAVREKIERAGPHDAIRLVKAASALSEHTQTNLTFPQIVALHRLYGGSSPKRIRHVSLEPLTEVFEVTRFTDPGEAVRTRTGDYREFHALAQSLFVREGTAGGRGGFVVRSGGARTRPAGPVLD